jgi:hypothetical protein
MAIVYNKLGLKVCSVCGGRLFINGQCLGCVKVVKVPAS